jgi:hypothetical protein
MYDDIIKKDLTAQKKHGITWNRNCGNCNFGSMILSKYPEKVYCQQKSKHMEKAFFCYKHKKQGE